MDSRLPANQARPRVEALGPAKKPMGVIRPLTRPQNKPLGTDSQIYTSKLQASKQTVKVKPRSQIRGLTKPKRELPIGDQLQQDFLLTCNVMEAKLSKDFSSFLTSMKIFCKVKFSTKEFQFDQEQLLSCSTGGTFKEIKADLKEETKATCTSEGQSPSWEEEQNFEFPFRRLTDFGIEQIRLRDKSQVPPSNLQTLEFSLFLKKPLLWQDDERLGGSEISFHATNSDLSKYEDLRWLVVTNGANEEVGQIKVSLTIQEVTQEREMIRALQEDLKNHQDVLIAPDKQDPGMVQDRTKMPLRQPEQVFLLNESKEQAQAQEQSQHTPLHRETVIVNRQTTNNGTSNPTTNPQTQAITQVTHVTHQTQNSAIGGNIGSVLQARLSTTKSPQGDNLQSTGLIGGITSTQGNQQVHTQGRTHVSTSLNGAQNTAQLTQLNAGTAPSLDYLETTNIIPNNKLQDPKQANFLAGEQDDEDDEEGEEEEDEEYEQQYGPQENAYQNHQFTYQRPQVASVGTYSRSHLFYQFQDQNRFDIQQRNVEDSNALIVGGGGIGDRGFHSTHPADIQEQYGQEDDYGEDYGDEVDHTQIGYMPQERIKHEQQTVESSHTQNPNAFHRNQPQKPVAGLGQSPPDDDDDESNINSDEQNEYLEGNYGGAMKQNAVVSTEPAMQFQQRFVNPRQIQTLQAHPSDPRLHHRKPLVNQRPHTSTNAQRQQDRQMVVQRTFHLPREKSAKSRPVQQNFQVQTEPTLVSSTFLPPRGPKFEPTGPQGNSQRPRLPLQNQPIVLKSRNKLAVSVTPGAIISGPHKQLVSQYNQPGPQFKQVPSFEVPGRNAISGSNSVTRIQKQTGQIQYVMTQQNQSNQKRALQNQQPMRSKTDMRMHHPDLNIGEIDDRDLLEDNCSSQEQQRYYQMLQGRSPIKNQHSLDDQSSENEVNSEGDEEQFQRPQNYKVGGPHTLVRQTKQHLTADKAKKKIKPKVAKLKQLVGVDPNHNQQEQNYQIGQNPLEQETFSLKQDTFQIDPNAPSQTQDSRAVIDRQQMQTFVSDGARMNEIRTRPLLHYNSKEAAQVSYQVQPWQSGEGYNSMIQPAPISKSMIKQLSESKLYPSNLSQPAGKTIYQQVTQTKVKKRVPEPAGPYANHTESAILQSQGIIQHITSHSQSSDEEQRDPEEIRREAEAMAAIGLNPPNMDPQIFLADNKLRRNSAAKSKKNIQQNHPRRDSNSIEIGGGTLQKDSASQSYRAGESQFPFQAERQIEFSNNERLFDTRGGIRGGQFASYNEPQLSKDDSLDSKRFFGDMTPELQVYQNQQDQQFMNNPDQMVLKHSMNTYIKNSSKKPKTRNIPLPKTGGATPEAPSEMQTEMDLRTADRSGFGGVGPTSSINLEVMSQQNNRALAQEQELKKMQNSLNEQFKKLKEKTRKLQQDKEAHKEEVKKFEKEKEAKEADLSASEKRLQAMHVDAKMQLQQIQMIHNLYEEMLRSQGEHGDEKLAKIQILMEMLVKSNHEQLLALQKAGDQDDKADVTSKYEAFLSKMVMQALQVQNYSMRMGQQFDQMNQGPHAQIGMQGPFNFGAQPPILSLSGTSQVHTPQPLSHPNLITQAQQKNLNSLPTEQVSQLSNQRQLQVIETPEPEKIHFHQQADLNFSQTEQEHPSASEAKPQAQTGQFNQRNMSLYPDQPPQAPPPLEAPEDKALPEEEEEKEENQSSSMSEFVPDPDFLLKVNENIRRNNQMVSSQQHPEEPWKQYTPAPPHDFKPHQATAPPLRESALHPSRIPEEDSKSKEDSDLQYRIDQQEEEKAHQENQRMNSHCTEIISDCVEIPVDEEIARQAEEERKEDGQHSPAQLTQGQVQAVMQGTQGDFIGEDEQDSAVDNGGMGYLSVIQDAIRKIGNPQPPHPLSREGSSQSLEGQIQQSGRNPQSVEPPLAAAQAEAENNSASSEIEPKEVDDIKLDFNEVLIQNIQDSGQEPQAKKAEERKSGSSEESSEDEEEQSVEYRDGKVFDEVKRAQYGIISVKK